MIETFPLESIDLETAIMYQHKLVDEITKVFSHNEFLNLGDLGLTPNINKPHATKRVEDVIANFFDAESAILVRGAGTAAIREGLFSLVSSGDTILIHDAPIYPTTRTSIKMLNLKLKYANFNNLDEVRNIIREDTSIRGVLIQYSRQKVNDSYKISDVIEVIKENLDVPIITDDNYTVMKVDKIGIQLGATISGFSCFKLLGPEGIGCIVGQKKYIDKISGEMYSGGVQIQGYEALEVLRGLVNAPVSFAIQSDVCEKVIEQIKSEKIPEIKWIGVANAQSKVILVEFYDNIAKNVCEKSIEYGAAGYPIGSESKYELIPLFYRVSRTFGDYDTTLEGRVIRINPMRAGIDTVVRILKQSILERE